MKRHAVELLILLVVVAALAFKGARNEAKATESSSPLFYSALVDKRHRIFRVNWDGSGQREIWAGGLGSQPCFPVPSPDGRWVAFLDDRGGDCLCLVSSEGGQDRVLATDLRLGYWIKPQWSSDSQRILFERRQSDDVVLYSVELAGGEPRALRPGQFGSWSPDGQHLLYQSGRQWWMDESPLPSIVRLGGGRWSPDNRYLLSQGGGLNHDHPDTYVIEVATRKATLIQKDARHPVYSPDGRRIAFDRFRGQTSEIFIMNADGSDPHLLHSRGSQPLWHDDQIVFTGHPEDDPEAYVAWGIRPDGSEFHPVVKGITNLGVSWR